MKEKSEIKLGRSLFERIRDHRHLYLLLAPAAIYYLLFHYLPMYGVIMAFKDFSFRLGLLESPWVGFENFIYLFQLDDFYRVLWNSIFLNFLRLIFGFPAPIMLVYNSFCKLG